jgi:TonB family protein
LDRGLEGTVIALISIDTLGRVVSASIEKSAGRDFDNVVLAAAKATRFQAPTREGRPVPARFRRPYEFRLE